MIYIYIFILHKIVHMSWVERAALETATTTKKKKL